MQVSSHLKNAHPQLYDKSEDCCGCSACFAICPVRAIIMKPNDEGFLYPEIDFKKCIGCYRCISVCVFKDKKGGE
ncbi:MAG: 4Fe-4S dicluster domain-containing protein [Lachnospiraceae bacterium]|nr:4Fe-4S dicluster domain-containing protein [Lachnospiraceae bacterium]